MASVAAMDLKPSHSFLAFNDEPPPSRAAATTFLGADLLGRFLDTAAGLGREARCAPPYKTRGARLAARPSSYFVEQDYLRFFETSFVMSNIETCALPPKTTLSAASALIMRRFFLSCRLFFLM
jgi:hypothetical protein